MYIKKNKEGMKFWKGKELSKEEAILAMGGTKPGVNSNSDTVGGDMKQLSTDVELAVGNTHEKGGITMFNDKGKPYAEIEDKEVVKDDKVYSDRLDYKPGITYASMATKLGIEKGKFENNLKSSDIHKKNTAERMVQRKDTELAKLFTNQENSKKAYGGFLSNMDKNSNTTGAKEVKRYFQDGGDGLDPNTPNPAILGNRNLEDYKPLFDKASDFTGIGIGNDLPFKEENIGDIGIGLPTDQTYNMGNIDTTNPLYHPTSVNTNSKPANQRSIPNYGNLISNLTKGAGFASDIYNAKLINEAPQLPNPRLEQPIKLNTEYNIQPQLSENRDAYKDFARGVDANMSSSNIGIANKAAAYAQRLKSSNELFGQKANIETGLKNQETLANQGVTNRNLAKLSSYDTEQYNRTKEIQGAKSANIADVTERIGKIGRESSEEKLDNQRITNIGKLFNDNPAAAEKSYNESYDSYKNTGKLNNLKEEMSKRKSSRDTWNKDPRNENNKIED